MAGNAGFKHGPVVQGMGGKGGDMGGWGGAMGMGGGWGGGADAWGQGAADRQSFPQSPKQAADLFSIVCDLLNFFSSLDL